MVIADIIFIVLIVLFALEGALKGFVKTALGFFSSFICLIASILLAKPVTMLCNNIFNMTGRFAKIFISKFSGMSEFFRTPVAGEPMNAVEALAHEGGIKKFLAKILGQLAKGGEIAVDATPAQYFGTLAAGIVALIISTIGLFILIKIFINIVMLLTNRKKRHAGRGAGGVTAVNRLLGGTLGALKGLFMVGAVLLAISFVKYIPFGGKLDKSIKNSLNKAPVLSGYSRFVEDAADKITDSINLKSWTSGLIKNKYEHKV